MPNRQISKVLQHLRSAVVRGEDAELTDGQLLECFLRRREPAALEALVRRHGGMVWGVCLRVLRCHHDAEDAFQATFLVLLRKAATIVPRERVGCWLYGVAHQTALKARATRSRRQVREKQVPTMPEPAAAEQLLVNELAAILDAELSRLPDKFRAVLVLCELEGKTLKEAARQLGLPQGTAASRLARARALLAKRLTRHGLSVSTGALTTVLTERIASACVPASVVSSTIETVTRLAVAGATDGWVIPAQVAALTEEVLKAMFLSKLKAVTAVLLVLGACVLAAGTGLLVAKQPAARESASPQPAAEADRQLGDRTASRVDRHGDPLPPGAFARLGTVRLRHSGPVCSVAFSPDGTTVASGDDHGEMRLWQASTGKLRRAFVDPEPGVVRTLVFSPDGKWLASGRARISLWDVATGTRRPDFALPYARALAFSPDGKTMVVASDGEPIIRLYSVATGKLSDQIHEGHPWPINAVAYSPDGKILATASHDRCARVWDLATRKRLHQLQLPEGVTDVAWSSDGKRLATATNRTVAVWDVATETRLHQWDQGQPYPWNGQSRSLAFSPDGKCLTSVNRTWDLSSGKQVCTCEGRHTGSVAYAPDGTALATAGYDGAVRLHDPKTGKELPHLSGAGGAGEFLWLGMAPDSRRLLTLRGVDRPGACEPGSGRLQSWTPNGREVHDLVIDSCSRTAALSPNGAILAVAGEGGALTLWDSARGTCVRQLAGDDGKDRRGPGAPRRTFAVAFSPDNRLVASARRGQDIGVWEVPTGRLAQTLKGHREHVCFLAFSPDSRRLVSAGIDQKAHFWDLSTGKEWRPAIRLLGWVRSLSPDGKTWAIEHRGPTRRTLRICVIETGQEILRLEDAPGDEDSEEEDDGVCAFSPDGRTIAVRVHGPGPEAASTIRVIELATGGVRVRFPGHPSLIKHLVFSADGTTLASGSTDNTALLWDLLGGNHGQPGARELQALWDQLGGDAETAHQAMGRLTRAPAQTVAWLRDHLWPVPSAQVAQLIRDLDDEQFAVREQAEAALQRLLESAASALRQVLDGKPSAEVRRRVTRLLERLEEGNTPAQLRSLRAIEVLERMGTPEARKGLEDLAKGIAGARQTQEAKASLIRLAR
jgi:RNA polymerase sigma factor (sigma-70 family)